jgi:hypothetical protein
MTNLANNKVAGLGLLLPAILECCHASFAWFTNTGNLILSQGSLIEPSDTVLSTEILDNLRENPTHNFSFCDSRFAFYYRVLTDDCQNLLGYILVKQSVDKANAPGLPTRAEACQANQTADDITLDTQIRQLLKEYPQLREDIFRLNDELASVQDNPQTRMLLQEVTVGELAIALSVSKDDLLDQIKEICSGH